MSNAFSLSYRDENGLFKIALSALLIWPFALMMGIAAVDIASTTIGVLFLVSSYIKKDFHWLKESWFKVFLILWAYMIIRGFFTPKPIASMTQSFVFIRYALLTIALEYWLLTKASVRQALVLTLLATLIFATLNGLIQLVFFKDLFGNPIWPIDTSHSLTDFFGRQVHPVDYAHTWRLTGISGKVDVGAKFMMVMFPAIAYLLYKFQEKSSSILLKCLSFASIISFVLFVELTGERNATLETALGLVLLFFMCKSYRKTLVPLGIVILICTALLFKLLPGLMERGVSLLNVVNGVTHLDKKGDAVSYTSLMQTNWNIFVKNPIFGVGRTQYKAYCDQADKRIAVMKKDIGVCVTNPQNVYFEWLDETGIIGFILFLSIPFLWFRQCYKKRALLISSIVIIGVFIEIILRLWPLASSSSIFFAWCGGPLWLMAGWVLAFVNNPNEKRSHEKR